MAQSDTNQGQVRYSRETTWGETPSTPATTVMRITSESLAHNKETVVSEEVRSDRQRQDVMEVARSAAGDINFELTYGDFESFFESAVMGTIASAKVANSALTFAASTITGSTTASTIWANFKVGQWIRVHNANTAANNGVRKITAIASTVLTFTGATGSAEGPMSSATVNGRRLRNGATETSYFIEVDFTDITAVKYFTGMEIDSMSLDIASQAIVTGVFSFMGEQGATASTTQASSVVASATNNRAMTATANVGTLRENDAALSTAIQSISLSVANNLRAQTAVGNVAAIGIGAGGLDVSGNLQAYFEDITLYDKFIQHTSSSLSLRFTDVDSNVIVLTLPKIYYSAGDPLITGQDADVFVPLDWLAVRDPTTDNTIQVDFLPASV